MRLYLIRHGQSVNNAAEFLGTPRVEDPGLTDVGREQAQRLAEFMISRSDPYSIGHPEAVCVEGDYGLTDLICSPMRRALETAFPLAAATGLNPMVWEDIFESGGIWLQQPDGEIRGLPGMNRTEMERDFAGYALPESITERGWWNREKESQADREARAQVVAEKIWALSRTKADATIAMVAHQHFLALLLRALLESSIYDLHLNHYNTGYSRIDFLNDGLLRVRYINRFDHIYPLHITT